MKVYKANNKKSKFSALAVCLLLTAMLAIGGTLAYLLTSTTPVVNTFKPVSPNIEVDEPEWDNKVKQNVTIENIGQVDSFIRAKVVITWQKGNEIYNKKPVENTDYSIDWGLVDWELGSDGFYYYTKSVPAGQKTSNLIDEALWLQACENQDYTLSIEILSQAIQSTPDEAVNQTWTNVTALNGVLTLK